MKLTNKITAIILLLLICVTAFSSCAAKKSRSGGQTTESSSETEDPKDLSVSPEIEEAFNKAIASIVTLDSKTKKQLGRDYTSQYGYSFSISEIEAQPGEHLDGSFCYGSFSNCIVIFKPGNLDVISNKSVAGEKFSYGSSFGLYGYHDGVFYDLEEAYEQEYITKEEVATAAERHRTIGQYNSILSMYRKSRTALIFSDESAKESIEKAFESNGTFPGWLNIDVKEQFSSERLRYYGSYDECYVLLQTIPQTEGGTKVIADKFFDSSLEINLWAYCNGVLYTLQEAYENGYITQYNVGVAAARHREVERYIEAVSETDKDFTIELPSKETQEQLLNKYISYKGYNPDNLSDFAWMRWYGSFEDICFLMMECRDEQDVKRTETVANYVFDYSDESSILVWTDGKFMTMKDAYEKSLITKEMVAKIVGIHRRGMYDYIYID